MISDFAHNLPFYSIYLSVSDSGLYLYSRLGLFDQYRLVVKDRYDGSSLTVHFSAYCASVSIEKLLTYYPCG
jgi:hypothetical protein